MTTYTFDRELLKKQIDNFVTDDKLVILSNTPHGSFTAASKKIKAKRVGIAFAGSVFKNKDTISDVLDSAVFGMIIIDKKHLSDEIIKEFEEYEKTHSSVHS